MKKLFIGNIPFQATEAELESWFTQQGFAPTAVAIVRHRLTGDSRGFGFADFSTPNEASQAVESLNGGDYQGRRLMLSVARSEGPAVQTAGEQAAHRA
jgi:RNA recognition motif-containing protein